MIQKQITGTLGVQCMKKINKITMGVLISIFSVNYSFAEDINTLNQQKSKLRDTKGLMELESQTIQTENTLLELKIANKNLKRSLNSTDDYNGTYEVDKLVDPVFGDKLTKEDNLSFKSEKLYGKDSKNDARSLNKRDLERRGKLNLNDGQTLDIKALEERIKSFVKEEMNKEVINNEESVEEQDFKLDSSLSEVSEKTVNPSEKNVNTKLIDFSIKKLTIFGDKKSVKIGAVFESEKSGKKEKSDEVEILLEEGQIYTYYKKVYFVERITNKQVLIKNKTDNESIVKHI